METSRYQVKKIIDELKEESLVELKSVNISNEEENFPPYWGYTLTKKREELFNVKEYISRNAKLMEEAFK